MIDVCLINPPITSIEEDSCVHMPYNLICLGSVATKLNKSVKIYDLDFECKVGNIRLHRFFYDDLFKMFDPRQFELICITSKQNNLHIAIELIKRIKSLSKDSVVALGGPQPSLCGKSLQEIYPFIDIVARGEGELIFEDLLTRGINDLKSIKGISYFGRNQDIINNPDQEYIDNLDSLPVLDLSLIDIGKYIDFNGGGFFSAYLETGRGCPFACSFCSSSVMWRRKFRMKSALRIIEEMCTYKEFGIDNIELIHDNAIVNRSFVIDLCDQLIASDIDVEWTCSTRCENLDADFLRLLYKAGCRRLFFGLETGSSSIQSKCGKILHLDDSIEIIGNANEVGIKNTSSFIIGFPYEGWSDINETIELMLRIARIGSEEIQCHILKPDLGTVEYNNNCRSMYYAGDFFYASPIRLKEYGFEDEIINNPSLYSGFYRFINESITDRQYSVVACFIKYMVNFYPYSYYALCCLYGIQFYELAVKFINDNDIDDILLQHPEDINNLIIKWLFQMAGEAGRSHEQFYMELIMYESILGESVAFDSTESRQYLNPMIFKIFEYDILTSIAEIKRDNIIINRNSIYVVFVKTSNDIYALNMDNDVFYELEAEYVSNREATLSSKMIDSIGASDETDELMGIIYKN